MDQGDKANVIFSWKAHPAKQQPGKACVALAIIMLAGLGVAITAGHPLPGVLGAMLLVLSLQRFFFSCTFEIDQDGITARYLMTNKRAKWNDIRRFVHDRNGGYLSTRSRTSWLDAYRGVHLVFDDLREEAVAAISARLAAPRSEAQAIASTPKSQQPRANSRRAAGSPA